MSVSTPYRRSFDHQALEGTTKSPIVPLMDEVRAHLRKISIGLIVVGVLLLAVDLPNRYGLFSIVGGLAIGAFGSVQFGATNELEVLPMMVATAIIVVVCMLLYAGAYIADNSKDSAPKPQTVSLDVGTRKSQPRSLLALCARHGAARHAWRT